MTDHLGGANELARRFVACKGWRYRQGMVLSDGTVVVRVAANGQPVVAGGISRGGCALSETLPDLSDAATRGAILQLVREAWGDPCMHCQFIIAELNEPDCWMAIADCGIARREFVGRTEAEALLAALEAAKAGE